MPLKIDCPRCKQSLAVPTKLAGSYVTCPRCKGRLWVPAAGEGDLERGDVLRAGATSSPAAAKAGDSTADGKPAPADGSDGATPGVRATAGNGGAGGGNSAAGASAAPAADRNGAGPSWMPPLASNLPLGMRAVAAAAPAAPANPAAAPAARPGAGRNVPAPSPAPASSPAPAAPAAPMVVAKKTARMISAEAAPSSLQRAADGKLPELRLDDGARTLQSDEKHKAVSPLLLFAVLCLSAAFSMVAVMVDFEGPNPVRLREKNEARQKIELNYFPLVADQGRAKPAEPYQRLLAEAARAHARGDRLTERRMYNRVLDLLRGERDRFQRGLTGSGERDKELERQIIILLGDD